MRLSRYQLFIGFALATLFFLVFQLILVNYLKTFYRKNSSNRDETALFANPRFGMFRTSSVQSLTQLQHNIAHDYKASAAVAESGKRIALDNYVVRFNVPLDANNQNRPLMLYQLPFYNQKNLKLEAVFMPQNDAAVSSNSNQQQLVQKVLDEKRFRGIDKRKYELYLPNADGNFRCLNSNQNISFTQFNDDFCDCVDATDEPGTAACQFSTFYCSTQNEYLDDNFIPSYRVDDRICDCCDGSDESVVKCPNRCDQLIKQSQDKIKIRQKAQSEKQKYIVDGLSKNENLYGPQGVFYRLSLRCFEIKWTEYKFEVCPYKRVSQHKPYKNTQPTSLGTDSELALAEIAHKKVWLLKMRNGDAQFCPKPRESEIRFVCGIEDKLESVQEPQKCLYVFELQTPAAC